jgi:hypothetical protein
MKTEKLFELLTLVNGVRSKRWETVRQLVKLIGDGSIEIKSKKWADDWKEKNTEYYPLLLGNIDTWTTFDDSCIDLKFSNDTTKNNGQTNNQLICNVRIYNGDSFNGERKNLRFEALLWLPTSFIHNIEPLVESAFNYYLEDAYENHLIAVKKNWINTWKNKILKK